MEFSLNFRIDIGTVEVRSNVGTPSNPVYHRFVLSPDSDLEADYQLTAASCGPLPEEVVDQCADFFQQSHIIATWEARKAASED